MDQQTESKSAVARGLTWLLIVVMILAIGYHCNGMLRFTVPALDSIFGAMLYCVPFLAIRPVQRMPQRARSWAMIVLIPVLLFSSLLLLARVFGGEYTRTIQMSQLGNSTIELQDYGYGGAVGVFGLNIEQRRLIVPGLYLVKSVDFFDDAGEGTMSVEGPYVINVHVKGNYYTNDHQIDRTYNLKPWVYF